ncbi:hypothetical protein, partial [Asanoa siamensis]|uniref:hypothetical protein n=1 Tax=Asanoa siamensis TaxID=926357 RepID=UPI001940AFE4
MRDDLKSRYAALASEVDGGGLPSAGDLRRAADRRSRRRVSVLAGAAVAAMTAGGGAVLVSSPAATPPAPPPQPTSSPSAPTTSAPTKATATPTTPPARPTSPPARPVVRSIPERAFLDLPSDMRADGLSRSPTGAGLEVPALCDDPLRDDPAATARRSFETPYRGPDDPAGSTLRGTVTQTIIAYRPGGAADLMRRVRDDVDSCRTRTSGGLTVTIRAEAAPRYGDESIQVLEEVRAPADTNGPTEWDVRAVVIRVGDVVTVVMVDGWERSPSEPADVPIFARRAVETIEEWRG